MLTENETVDLCNEHVSCLVDNHNGIYSMQKLLEWYPDNCIVDAETRDIVLEGPDNEYYLECDIDDIVFVSRHVKDYGSEYILFWHEGDISCIPADLDDSIKDVIFDWLS